jgi:hypothetical protein
MQILGQLIGAKSASPIRLCIPIPLSIDGDLDVAKERDCGLRQQTAPCGLDGGT